MNKEKEKILKVLFAPGDLRDAAICIDHYVMTAMYAIHDEELAAVTAATGVDALSHAVESYVCTRRSTVSTLFAEQAFQLLERGLPQVLRAPRELVARIHAVLRRQTERLAPGAPATEGKVAFGPFTLDLAARTLVSGDATIHLTTGEFSLLKVFAQHARQPLAREKLMLLARGRDHDVFDRAIDVQVSRLRKLIEPDPAKPRYLQTVWGFGYVFVPDDGAADPGVESAPP
jgi:DNA-binding winged helix-turn-helix (wHTH) protein